MEQIGRHNRSAMDRTEFASFFNLASWKNTVSGSGTRLYLITKMATSKFIVFLLSQRYFINISTFLVPVELGL